MTRVGSSQVFFNIVAGFNARKLIQDLRAVETVTKAVLLDSFEALLKPMEGLSVATDVFLASIIDVAQETGKAGVEFEKFYGGANENLPKLREELIGIGEAYAIVGAEALAAGARAAQVGAIIGNENIPLLVQQAEILSQISDLTSEEAMKGIVQLQQQTGVLYGDYTRQQFAALDVMHQRNVLTNQSAYALDALNTIANRSVALEGDLVHTMTNFASQGQLVGEAFHDMAAMSAVLLEAGEEQGAAGRALRMMYARLGGDIGGATSKMEEMGFTIKDENGNLLTMREIMTDLSEKGWKNFSSGQKQNIAQTVAGNRHYVRFIKLMENQDRFLELAADGMAGLDSASEQAAKAMEDLANQLEIAETRGENLSAELGRNLTPFLIGQKDAANEMTDAWVELSSAFGGKYGQEMLNTLGRISGYAKSTGGFIKMGLGMQSMSVGIGMFEAVSKDLQGILVANENLHSKQATYLDYGVSASEKQIAVQKAIKFEHQRLNAILEHRQGLMSQVNALDQIRNPLLQREAELEQSMADKNQKIYDTDKQRYNLRQQSLTILSEQGNMHQRISNLVSLDLQNKYQEKDLLQEFNEYTKTKETTDRAKRRQMIHHAEVMANISETELQTINEQGAALERKSNILQRIVSEDVRRQGFVTATGDSEGAFGLGSFSPKDASAAYDIFQTQIKNKQPEFDKMIAKFKDLDQSQENYMDNLSIIAKLTDKNAEGANETVNLMAKEAMGLERLVVLMEKVQKGGDVKLDKSMRAVVSDMNYKAIGAEGQLVKMLKLHNSERAKSLPIMKKLADLDSTAGSLRREKINASKELIAITAELAQDDKEYQTLHDAIAVTLEKEGDVTKDLIALRNKMKNDSKLSVTQLKKYDDRLEANRKRMADSTKSAERLTFAFTSMASVALPALAGAIGGKTGGKIGALGSIAMLSGGLMSAGKQLGKATTEFWKLHSVSIATNTPLQNFNANLKNIVANNKMLVASLVVAIPLMIAYSLETNRAAEAAKDLAEQEQAIASSRSQLKNAETLFEDQAFADAIGMDNYTMNELVLTAGLAETALKDLEAVYGDLSAAQRDTADSTIDLLNLIMAINDESVKISNEKLWKEGVASLKDEVTGFAGAWEDLSVMFGAGAIGYLTDDDEAEDYLMGTGILDKYVVSVKDATDEIVSKMKDGRVLTDKELKAIGQLFDDDNIKKAFENLNKLVITDTEREQAYGWLEDAQEAIDGTGDAAQNTANDLKNLTDELYDFGGAREELFFGGKYGNVTGSLYKQVVKQGVGVLYNKMDIVMSNNFHGFFNEREAAERIRRALNEIAPSLSTA